MWKKLMTRTLMIAAIVASLAFGSVQPVEAGGTCWCAVKNQGACTPGTPDCAITGSASDITSCATTCDVYGSRFLNWAADPSQSPSSNLMCYAPDATGGAACDGKLDTSMQPEECLPGWRYCYSTTTTPTNLAVSIDKTTSVTDLGQYVGVMYNYLITIGLTIATVFIMVGGLQYVAGSATASGASEAKKRITNAISGFVLLLCCILILKTVNPNLLNMQPPQLPKIKTIESLTGDLSCEQLLEKDSAGKTYTLGEKSDGPLGPSWCGSIAAVEKDRAGTEVVDGTTCQYKTCATEGESCYGYGDDAKCLKCEGVVPGGSTGITPSEEVCTSFTYPTAETKAPIDTNGNTKKITYPTAMCIWSQEPGLVDNPLDAPTGTCAKVPIDCSQIHSCTDYGKILVTNDQDDECYMSVDPIIGRAADALGVGGYGSSTTFNEFCTSDPCGAAPAGESCVMYQLLPHVFSWSESSSILTCVNNGFSHYVGTTLLSLASGGLDFQATALKYLKERDGSFDAYVPTADSAFCSVR